jgi:hypothetical protein
VYVFQRLKAGIMEPEGTAVARQRLDKRRPAATHTQTHNKELLDPLFSLRSVSHQIQYAIKGK